MFPIDYGRAGTWSRKQKQAIEILRDSPLAGIGRNCCPTSVNPRGGYFPRALANNVSPGIVVAFVPAEPTLTPTDAQALSVAKKYVTNLPKNCRVRGDLRRNRRGTGGCSRLTARPKIKLRPNR